MPRKTLTPGKKTGTRLLTIGIAASCVLVIAVPAALAAQRTRRASLSGRMASTAEVVAARADTSPSVWASPAAPTSPETDNGGPLSFDMPGANVLRSSPKLAFAHYFPPFPISLDDKNPASDYYARNYLDPDGESGKHAAYGGLLRDRPIGRTPLGAGYFAKDMETEVKQAIAAGLDGFSVDILSTNGRNWDLTIELLEAAHRVDPAFKIMLMPDMTTLNKLSAADLANLVDALGKYPAAFRLADNRLVVSPFKAENQTAAWWSDWLNQMKNTYRTTVAFVPTFLDWQKYADSFTSISYGFSHWGGANPGAAAKTTKHTDKAHGMGKLWMAPVRVQDERPRSGIFDEAGNTETLRLTWQGVIDSNAEWVQIPTWNDYSENTDVAPSATHGWSFLDISAYYLTRWKTGKNPALVRDTLYVTHRKQPYSATPTYPQTKLMALRSGTTPARDTVEVLAFLTSPATVTITVGSSTYTWEAPAGVNATTVPLSTGGIAATATRGGAVAAQIPATPPVTAEPYVQDLQYVAVSSRR